LITLGGYHAYNAGGWDRSALADILPIQMTSGPRQGINAPIDLRNHHPGPIRILPRAADKLLQIGEPGSDVAKVWSEMKPLIGANRWDGIKNAPGVQLLAQGDAGQPLIVTGAAAKGRVVSLAFDSSYQWLRQGKGVEYKQFWRQLVLWCLRRENIEEGMQLSMTQRRLFLQQTSDLVLAWNPGSSDAAMPETILMRLWRLGAPGEQGAGEEEDMGEFRLLPRDTTSRKLTFEGAKEPGRYEWRALASGSKGQQVEARLPFIVMDQSVESLQPLPDWQLLSQLAKLNATAGGELLVPEQAQEIVRRILERRRQATETQVENVRLGDTAIDAWGLFLVVAALMVTQWVLRKRWALP